MEHYAPASTSSTISIASFQKGTMPFRPVRLKSSSIKSSATSQKYSCPGSEQNQLIHVSVDVGVDEAVRDGEKTRSEGEGEGHSSVYVTESTNGGSFWSGETVRDGRVKWCKTHCIPPDHQLPPFLRSKHLDEGDLARSIDPEAVCGTWRSRATRSRTARKPRGFSHILCDPCGVGDHHHLEDKILSLFGRGTRTKKKTSSRITAYK
jgi:hypothetical protein